MKCFSKDYILADTLCAKLKQLQTTCTKETGNGSNMIKPDYDPNSTWRQPTQNQGNKLKIQGQFQQKRK